MSWLLAQGLSGWRAMDFAAGTFVFSPRLRGLIANCGPAGVIMGDQLASAGIDSIVVLANCFDSAEEAVAGLERPGHLYGGPPTGVGVGDLWTVAEAFCAQSARGGVPPMPRLTLPAPPLPAAPAPMSSGPLGRALTGANAGRTRAARKETRAAAAASSSGAAMDTKEAAAVRGKAQVLWDAFLEFGRQWLALQGLLHLERGQPERF